MAREIYNLTDATRDTLTDRVKAMANAWNKTDKYIYAILDESKTDPFAPFLSMYRGVLKAGLSTSHYDRELEFERLRHDRSLPVREAAICFKDKLRTHNETLSRYIEYLQDGDLDAEEIPELQKLLIAERDAIDLNLQALEFKLKQLTGPLRAA